MYYLIRSFELILDKILKDWKIQMLQWTTFESKKSRLDLQFQVPSKELYQDYAVFRSRSRVQ